MSKEIKDEEVDKLLEDELFREAKMIEKSLLGDHADEPSVSDEEIDKAYERFMQRVKKEGLQKENSQDTQTAEIVKFPGSRGMDKWERELEEIGRTVDDSWDDQDPVQEENNFVNELSNLRNRSHGTSLQKRLALSFLQQSVFLQEVWRARRIMRNLSVPLSIL